MATLVQHILYQEAMDVGPLRSPRSGRLIWDLDASEVGGLNSIPFPLLPAQGVGTVIMPVAGSYQYKAGSVPFAVAAALRVAPWTADPTDGGLRTGNAVLLAAGAALAAGARVAWARIAASRGGRLDLSDGCSSDSNR
jgi:hypothetical protein